MFEGKYLILQRILTLIRLFMRFTELAYPIFEQSIKDYHVDDNIDQPVKNPYEVGCIEHDLYMKNWIDTVQ